MSSLGRVHGWLRGGLEQAKVSGQRGCVTALIPTLFCHELFEQALHRLEGVVDHFAQWLVHVVCYRLFICHQLVAGRDGNVDPYPERIAGTLRVIWMFDDDVAPADVIAEAIKPRGLAANQFIELVRCFDAPL